MAEVPKSVVNTDRDPAMQTNRGGNIRGLFQVYVRILSALYLVMGLSSWWTILGLGPTNKFLDLPVEHRVSEIFFAVSDLVAATGLWLLSSWGVVVWMACAIAETSLNVILPQKFSFELLPVAFNVLSLLFYLAFTLIVSRED